MCAISTLQALAPAMGSQIPNGCEVLVKVRMGRNPDVASLYTQMPVIGCLDPWWPATEGDIDD